MLTADTIRERFGNGALKLSALNLLDGEPVLCYLLQRYEVRRVLEIGTFQGASAAFMAQFCEHVDTIDLQRGRVETLRHAPLRHDLWEEFGLDNIDLHLVLNDNERSALIDKLDFDFAFIDGDKVGVAQDFEAVRRCGRVLFHDMAPHSQPEQDYTPDFVNQLDGVTRWGENFALWTA